MKLLFLYFFFGVLLIAQEENIDDLLSQYHQASELSYQTAENKSGHVIIFSRSDLDTMQAYTLNDVLKTLKMFTLKNTSFGSSTLIKTPYSQNSTSSIKIYINSHEVTSLTSGTGIAQFGQMGLNHIDHIEVYQASDAIAFHGEPESMVIKLYTKDPSRENATVIQSSLDSQGGGRGQIIEAQSFGDHSYLVNVDMSAHKYNKEKNQNEKELSRDGMRGQLYFNFAKKDDYLLEGGFSKEKSDIFNGFAQDIEGGDITSNYNYIQLTKYLPSQTQLIISGLYEKINVASNDAVNIPLFDGSPSTNLHVNTGSYAYDILLQKHHNFANHHFLFGAEAKLKTFFIDTFKSDGLEKEYPFGPRNLDIYMLFIEDSYDINENHQLIFGGKAHYYDNHLYDAKTEKILRFAYLGKLSEEFLFKSFIQKGHVYPIFSQTTFSPLFTPNPDLKTVDTRIIKAELQFIKENLTLTFGTGVSNSKNNIVFNKASRMYINNNKSSDFSQLFLTSEYKFNAHNKLIAEYFKAYKENASFTSDEGALVQLFTTFGKFDLYNELVYRSSYTGLDGIKIDAGYDYTAGVIYHYDKQLSIKLKGENIFDKAIETSIDGTKIPTHEQRALLTLEYIF